MATDKPMQLGMVGLGRMGAGIVRRLMADGHRCVGYDRNEQVVSGLEGRPPGDPPRFRFARFCATIRVSSSTDMLPMSEPWTVI